MNRRTFLKNSAMAGALLALPTGCKSLSKSTGATAKSPTSTAMPFLDQKPAMQELLRTWCDALLVQQIREPNSPGTDGAYACPACGIIHGRCADSVYPLLYMAQASGESKYLEAALRVMAWTKNVDAPDGSWTNDLDPKSWKGITAFAAIAQAEALEHHGQLLDLQVRDQWRARLHRAAEFIFTNFNMDYANINYPVTGSYALELLGRLFDEDKYRQRGRELAHAALKYFTPNGLLFGEGRPADQRSPKGCLPVDLGYNVEESLPSLAIYGLLTHDEEVLAGATTALAAHLEFMLPDGAWDNSWGTRSYKWTYWGSRTSDGCEAAYALLADRHPGFATAAVRNFQLLRECTHNGLLYGGPHYFAHQVPPCVHHTFCHAKALTTVLDRLAGELKEGAALPRETASGVREYPEINTCLAAHGPWRATVTGYDWVYHDSMHATGGALALLHHAKVGTLFAASQAKYRLVEPNNMQPLPDGLDFPLTPRIEMQQGDGWFTNLYDLTAKIAYENRTVGIEFRVETRLVDESQHEPAGGAMKFRLTYRLDANYLTIRVEPDTAVKGKWSVVLPLVSQGSEAVRKMSDVCYQVVKPGGNVLVETNATLRIMEEAQALRRAFNLVPGFEAVPFVVEGNDAEAVLCRVVVMV
jgi:hypothetical protein